LLFVVLVQGKYSAADGGPAAARLNKYKGRCVQAASAAVLLREVPELQLLLLCACSAGEAAVVAVFACYASKQW
jgi:hypothetical protein